MASCQDGSCVVVPLTQEQRRQQYESDPANIPQACQDILDSIINISQGFHYGIRVISAIEESTWNIWDEIIHLAKIIPSESAEHDRLISVILRTRQCGALTRKSSATSGSPEETDEKAITSDGQSLWADLPGLAQELHDSWVKESQPLDSEGRERLATFTAKLCGVGVLPEKLSYCALWLFKEALEKDQPQTSLAELLPAIRAWTKQAKHVLVKLAVASHDFKSVTALDYDPDSLLPGDLCQKEGILEAGFNLRRWLFWRKRLGDIYQSGDEAASQIARDCFEEMVAAGSAVALRIPGEERFLRKAWDALDEVLLKNGSGNCVQLSEIAMDPAWAYED